jgi:putative nucleotidyltransferase with HDIG domain
MSVQTAEAAKPAPAPSGLDHLPDLVAQMILRRINENAVIVPALPPTMMKCLELVRKPNFDFDALVALVEREPMLAAQALRQANSAAQAVAGKVTNVKAALTRLGTKSISTLVIELAAERLFVSRDTAIVGEATAIWKHSVAVAIAARDLRAVTAAEDTEEAYLAGLLQDIGKPIVAGLLLEAERQIVEKRGQRWITSEQWRQVVKRTHQAAGIAVAKKWELPDAVISAVRDSADFNRAERESLANAVCFANALTDTAGLFTHPDDADESKTMVMIGKSMLGITDELADRIRDGLKERVGDLAMR